MVAAAPVGRSPGCQPVYLARIIIVSVHHSELSGTVFLSLLVRWASLAGQDDTPAGADALGHRFLPVALRVTRAGAGYRPARRTDKHDVADIPKMVSGPVQLHRPRPRSARSRARSRR